MDINKRKKPRMKKTEMLSILIAFSLLSFLVDYIKVEVRLISSIGQSPLGKYR